MTLQAFNTYDTPFWMPGSFYGNDTTATGLQLNAAGDKMGWIFIAPRSETIDVAAFKSTLVGTGGDVTVQIEGVNLTNGRPDSSTVGSSTVVTTVSATPATYEVTGLAASLTAGTPYALTLTSVSGDTTFTRDTASVTTKPFPYAYQFIDGATHALTRAVDLQVALGRSVTDYIQIPGFVGPVTSAYTTVTDAGNPDEVGMIFNLPYKARLAGVHVNGRFDNNWTLKAYSSPTSSPALLTSMSLSVDAEVASANTHAGWRPYLFPAEIDLSINTDYAVTCRFGTTGSRLGFTYADADIMKCVTGNMKGYLVGRQNDTGDFTETTTILPAIVPLFSKLSDDASAGNSVAIPIGGRMAQV